MKVTRRKCRCCIAPGSDEDAQRYVTCGRRCKRGRKARRRIIRVKDELQSAAVHGGVGQGQFRLEETTLLPLLEMAERQDAAPEEGPGIGGMDTFQSLEDEEREPSLGLVAIKALTQGLRSYLSLQN